MLAASSWTITVRVHFEPCLVTPVGAFVRSFCSSYRVSGAVRLQWSHPTAQRAVQDRADQRRNRPDRARPRQRRPDSQNDGHGQGHQVIRGPCPPAYPLAATYLVCLLTVAQGPARQRVLGQAGLHTWWGLLGAGDRLEDLVQLLVRLLQLLVTAPACRAWPSPS